MSNLVNIEINGKQIQIREGAMLIEAADEANIAIPRFCYHKKLSIAANCRMCLVQVEKAPKPLPACATPVSEGMKVFTESDIAKTAQKAVMEFLLINHPLDCPVCDQGGECELQDVSLEYGKDISRYTEPKRVIKDQDIGPLISTEMTRCIHCTRCVRFGDEVAGMRELGATGRGEHMEIGTYLEHSVDSELSGNVIDLCPVGALTSKPFRFKARAWELCSRASVAPHDCVGSNIFVHTFRNKVLRVIPRENEAINENWISDRDRFSYEGINHADRLLSPKIKKNGQWQDADWQMALDSTLVHLKKTSPNKLGALISPSSTVEDFYLLQKMIRSLGSSNIDHRLHTADTTDQAYFGAFPVLGRNLDSLENCDVVYIIGGYVRKEQPMLNHRLRKAAGNGAKIMVLSDYDMVWNFDLADQQTAQAGDYITPLLSLIKTLSAQPHYTPDSETKNLAAALMSGETKAIVLGSQVLSHPQLHMIRYLAHELAKLINSTVGELPLGANSAGAWLAGALPHRGPVGQSMLSPEQAAGLTVSEMLEHPLDTYVLVNIEPEYDCLNPKQALESLQSAKTVILMTPYVTEAMLNYADILLPITPLYETAGTLVNVEGNWQSVEPASRPQGDAWPAWKIFNTLGGFDYRTTKDIMLEMVASFNEKNTGDKNFPTEKIHEQNIDFSDYKNISTGLIRLAPVASLAIDNITRRAEGLQKTKEAQASAVIGIHPKTAADLQLGVNSRVQVVQNNHASSAVFSLDLNEAIPQGSLYLPAGLSETRDLGAPYTSIELVESTT